MSETETGPVDLGQDRPHSARMYDYYLGGRTNYAADRAAAEQVIERFPAIGVVARVNRSFMHRATRFFADSGVTRFLDIGTGIPTSPNLHEVAQQLRPEARVVYVDNDPLVLVYADALLDSAAEGSTAYVEADVNDPEAVLRTPAVQNLLADGEPVALSLNALLHFVGDKSDPRWVVETLVQALPSGSYLALSHCTDDFAPQAWRGIERIYRTRGTYLQVRGHDDVTSLFEGLELVEPGVVVGHHWKPEDGNSGSTLDDEQVSLYVGVARKP